MRATRYMLLLLLGVAFVAPPPEAIGREGGAPSFELEWEAGPVWQTVNDQQIPNTAAGSRFSLVDLVGNGPQFAYRGYLTWRLGAKSTLRALYAPLSFTEAGVPEGPIAFNGTDFAAGREAAATYRFDSYRLTYGYRIHEGRDWRWRIGFTAKIRVARVQLEQDGIVSTKDNTGFVPLLHVAGRRQLGDRWFLDLDVDALAGGPGRAEDVALKLGRRLDGGIRLAAGYRMIEGGADVEEVYSFAWLHYAVMSVAVPF